MALERLVLLVSAVGMLALATLILAVGIGRGIHRAFAALLGARGLSLLLPQLSPQPQWTATAVNLQPYFVLAVAPLALYCLVTLGQTQRSRWWGWATVAAIGVLDLAYWANHALFHTLEPGRAAIGALQATADLQYTGFGPLTVAAGLGGPLVAALGLRIAMQYRNNAYDPGATTLLLLATGLLVGALFDGASRLVALANLLDGPDGFPWAPWGWAVLGLPVLALAPGLLGTAVLASGRSLDPRPLHRLEGNAIVLLLLAFFTGFLRLIAPADSDIGGHPMVLVLLGAWRLVMPVTLTYAILHDAWADSVAASAARDTARPALDA